MNLENMTGLEVLTAIADGHLPHPPISEIIPMTMEKIEHGEVTFSAKADARHLNPLGGVHGGFAATILDSVTGCAVHSVLDAGTGYATIDLNVKMLRPVPTDTVLQATGRVINVSKTIAVSEGELRNTDGKLCAHATCTCKIIRP